MEKIDILILEDDNLYQSILQEMLSEHNVIIAGSVKEAKNKYDEQGCDVSFLDINLPDGSGHEVMSYIVKSDPNCFIIMTTGSNLQSDVKKSLNEGAKGYLVKPFTQAQIDAYIHKYRILNDK